MSVNSSASSNDTYSDNSSSPFWLDCLFLQPSSLIFITYLITSSLLLLPLCILVLYHGLQRWRQQRSSTTAVLTSHSDIITYHMVAIELSCVFRSIICLYGIFMNNDQMVMVGFQLLTFTWLGETFFHLLTCVEPYLAVVHPVTYLSLKTERGVRMRNVCIGCIWLFCIIGSALIPLNKVLGYFLMISSVIAISFCCLSVLCVLIRPGPGQQGRNRDRVDQSKQRAFYTIVVILGVLLLRCTWNLVWSVLYELKVINACLQISGVVWIHFSGSLVLPLLFLHRAGKLGCCKTNIR